MKLQITLLALIFSLGSAFAQKQKFEIKGTVDNGLVGKKLYFSRVTMYGSAKAEAVPLVVNARNFVIKGEIEEPERGIISLTKDAKADTSALAFMIDKGIITIQLKNTLTASIVSGSKADVDFKEYIAKTSAETHEFNEFYKELEKKAMQGSSRDSLQLVFQNGYQTYNHAMNTIRLAYVKANPGSFTSLLLLPEIVEYSQNYNQIDSLYASLGDDIKKSPSAKIINEKFKNDRLLSIGAVAPDFSQPDVNGKQVKLSDFRGKYILVDFWASWCGPCRQENPNVVRIYNQFKDKNFTILGVSLDRPGAKQAWLKAIEDDKLAWTQVSDLNFWKNEAAVKYGIQAIPQNFLLDPQGKILAKNLTGENLESALSEILSKN
jgi:peroxiredoxin